MLTISISTLLPRGWLFWSRKNNSHHSFHLQSTYPFSTHQKPWVVGGDFIPTSQSRKWKSGAGERSQPGGNELGFEPRPLDTYDSLSTGPQQHPRRTEQRDLQIIYSQGNLKILLPGLFPILTNPGSLGVRLRRMWLFKLLRGSQWTARFDYQSLRLICNLQMKKLRLREGKRFAQSHTGAWECQSQLPIACYVPYSQSYSDHLTKMKEGENPLRFTLRNSRRYNTVLYLYSTISIQYYINTVLYQYSTLII